jgi:hypothetical protein
MKRVAWLFAISACASAASYDPDARSPGGDSGGSADGATGDAATPPSSFGFDGPERAICDGNFHAPTLVAADNRFVVGCRPSGPQNTIPQVKFLNQAGSPVGQVSLLTSDGAYYEKAQLSHHDGRFQVIYEYNCDDDGTWLVGWGWGCIELRELDDTGDQITALQFGETGHNGHPVLDGHDSELGIGWVSYDDAYFRRLGPTRELVGGRDANLFLGPDPRTTDARSRARTQVAWDGAGYGVFSIIGTHMYFSRVEMSDHIAVAMKDLGVAYSETFDGEFTAVSVGGTYYVAYDDTTSVKLVNFDRNGGVVKSVVAQAGEYRHPQLIAAHGWFYVVTEDAGGRGYVTVFDSNLSKVTGGLLGGGLGRVMVHPRVAVDGATWVVAYQAAQLGSVKLQRLAPMP